MEEKYKLIWENVKNNMEQVIEILKETGENYEEIEKELQMEYNRIDALALKYEEKIRELKQYCSSPFSNLLQKKMYLLLLSMMKQSERLLKRNQKNSQTFSYTKKTSLLNGLKNEYNPTMEEWYKLYVFYVAYSMGQNQSCQGKTYVDYGWKGSTLNSSGLKAN